MAWDKLSRIFVPNNSNFCKKNKNYIRKQGEVSTLHLNFPSKAAFSIFPKGISRIPNHIKILSYFVLSTRRLKDNITEIFIFRNFMLNLPVSQFVRLITTSTNTLKKQTDIRKFKWISNENERFDHLPLWSIFNWPWWKNSFPVFRFYKLGLRTFAPKNFPRTHFFKNFDCR